MELTYAECKAALRMRLNAMHEQALHWQNPCSIRQCAAIVILLNQCLEDTSREVRLAVIQEMIDIPVQSTKDLLKWEATCLIDFIKDDSAEWSLSDHGRKFIGEAQRRITKNPEGGFEEYEACGLFIL